MTGAERNDYEHMAAVARVSLEEGKTREDVLHACYGVSFPNEIFVLTDMEAEGQAPSLQFCFRPWNLMLPLDRGGPPENANVLDEDQTRVTELDETAIALLILSGEDYKNGGYLLCYQRDELAAGRSTVVGFRRELAKGTVGRRLGDSLAAVIVEHYADNVRKLEKEYSSPYNRGAGSLDEDELEGARENLACARELVRRVAERTSRTR